MSTFEPTFELVWKGGLHFGDAPGIFDDAHFVGLAGEWPMTLRKFDASDTTEGRIALRLESENVKLLTPSSGHRLSIVHFAPEANGGQRWRRTPLAIVGSDEVRSDAHAFEIAVPNDAPTIYLGLRLEVDASVAPGLLNDFVVRRLSLKSATHYATFGFQFEPRPLVMVKTPPLYATH